MQKNAVGNRRGSQIVEATMVLPITILIMAALIGVLLSFFTGFMKQVENHVQERTEMYELKEISILRIRDNLPVDLQEVNRK